MRLYLSSFRLGDAPKELVRLAGGGRRMAVIANANDAGEPERREVGVQDEIARVAELGFDPTELDLREFFGRSDEVEAELSRFDALWVRGGNVFVLRRAMRMSGADTAIVRLLQEDALVYGGYSAGVCVLAPTLRGLELVDGAEDVPMGYHPAIVWEGLGVLPYSVAPHYRSDHPESEAVERVVERLIADHQPFVALKDGEVIVRDGSSERVGGGRT